MNARRTRNADSLIDFSWRLPAAGYRFVFGETSALFTHKESEKGKFLVPAISSYEPQRVIEYSPLATKTGLFKRFAETSTSEKEILSFANEHGCLGGTLGVSIHPSRESSMILNAEPLTSWQQAIKAMSEMLLIWESARTPDLARLSSRISWDGSAAVFYKTSDSSELIATDKTNPELMERFTAGNLVQPAMYLLQRRVNTQLVEHGVSAKLLWNPNEGRLAIRLSANSLIGALWLQFAKAIEGNKNYRQCKNCRDWIEVGGNRTARSDKEFCTPSCKSAWHRKNPKSPRETKKSGGRRYAGSNHPPR